MVPTVFRGLAGAFAGATVGWITCGLLTSGDLFASGKGALALFVVVAALVGGAYLGVKARSKRRQLALFVTAAVCLVFWVAAPNGWWALPPPKATEVHVR